MVLVFFIFKIISSPAPTSLPLGGGCNGIPRGYLQLETLEKPQLTYPIHRNILNFLFDSPVHPVRSCCSRKLYVPRHKVREPGTDSRIKHPLVTTAAHPPLLHLSVKRISRPQQCIVPSLTHNLHIQNTNCIYRILSVGSLSAQSGNPSDPRPSRRFRPRFPLLLVPRTLPQFHHFSR